MSDLRTFKVAFRASVLALRSQPCGFTRADLADHLGQPYDSAPHRARLDQYVERSARNGILRRVSRGRFAVGERFAEADALGVGVRLEADVRDAFIQNGGVLSMQALLGELGLSDSTYPRRILKASSDYTGGIPFAGFKTAWKLVDCQRVNVPLPGNLLAFEISTLTGGDRQRETPRLLQERRRLIGSAVTQARCFAHLEITDIVGRTTVAASLEDAMRKCEATVHIDESRPVAVQAWWDETRATLSRRASLAAAWAKFEAGDPLLVATTVRFWQAVGAALKVSPSHLSRGCLAPMDDTPI